MRQIIMKKKKRTKVYQIRRKARRIAALAAASCLLYTGMSAQVWAQEEIVKEASVGNGEEKTEEAEEEVKEDISSDSGVAYDIFHRHTGNEAEGGGCYQEVIYHSHQGSEAEGGDCYQTPVYHIHQGNETEGGSCYGTTIYHTHQGSVSEGGACYTPTYHTHSSSCTTTAECTVEFVEPGDVTGTTEKYCSHHQEITHLIRPAKEKHSSCGSGLRSTTITYCRYCGYYGYTHTYSQNVCGQSTGTVTGYQLACGKNDTTPESYELDCSKDGETIDAYSLSCEKDGQTIEGYSVNCGFDESQPVAKLVILNETEESKEQVSLRVEVEDLTEGKLDFTGGSFQWYDSAGNTISGESSVEVSDNGEYCVEFFPDDTQMQLSGLSGSICVNNVYKPTPKPPEKKEETDTGKEKTDKEEEGDTGTEENETEEQPEATPMVSPSPTATPSATPKKLFKEEAFYEEENSTENSVENKTADDTAASPTPKETVSPTPTDKPSVTPPVKKNTEADEEIKVLGQDRKEKDISRWLRKLSDFFAKPVVKVITVTTGTLTAGVLLGICIVFLCKTVKVYNDDGAGQMTCLGRCMVTREKDDFCITISQAMVERSCTNRYAIRPGLFLLGKAEDQELFVCKDGKRIAVYLNKEMIVVI